MCIVPERRRRLIGMCQRGRPSKQKPCEFVWNEIATPLFLFSQSPWENSGELRHGKFSSSWRLGTAPSGSWERVQVTAFGAIMGSRRPPRQGGSLSKSEISTKGMRRLKEDWARAKSPLHWVMKVTKGDGSGVKSPWKWCSGWLWAGRPGEAGTPVSQEARASGVWSRAGD